MRRSTWRWACSPEAAAQAGLPPWPITRAETIGEDDEFAT